MGRTRLFHTVVIVGSSLLANCDKGTVSTAPNGSKVQRDPANPPMIMAERPPPPPRIHAITPEKMGEPLAPPTVTVDAGVPDAAPAKQKRPAKKQAPRRSPPPPRIHAVTPEKMGGSSPLGDE